MVNIRPQTRLIEKEARLTIAYRLACFPSQEAGCKTSRKGQEVGCLKVMTRLKSRS